MTARQRQLLDFIRDYMQQHGYSPSYAEMAQVLAVNNKSGIHNLIRILQRDGFIERCRGRSRSLRLIGQCADDIATADSALLAAELARRGYTVNPPLAQPCT
jgi:SOS-response transcriptional repressor LexA